MAGNYPDPPGNRLAYDKDGTLGYHREYTPATDVLGSPVNEAGLKNMNDDGASTSHSPGSGRRYGVWWLIFPAPRDISHVHLSMAATGSSFEWSSDTTNGVDGTWTAVTVANRANDRVSIRTLWNATPTILGARGVRAICSNNPSGTATHMYTLHLYGKPSAAVADRLVFWHPTLDQPLRDTPAHLDWGNRPRGTSQTRQFRIKNVSPTLTANSITVGFETLTDATPSLVTQHQFRYNAGSYATTATLASLAPGAVSAIFDVQQNLDAGAATSLWSGRVYANAATWV
jgi:hypothetical protein